MRLVQGTTHRVAADGDDQRAYAREPNWIPGSPCRHRGEVLREMECDCAGGRKVVDVYGCSVHSECTLRNTKAGTDKPHVCLGCEDWDGEV